MAGSFGGIEIGKRSLMAHQMQINTAGHNISNAEIAVLVIQGKHTSFDLGHCLCTRGLQFKSVQNIIPPYQ